MSDTHSSNETSQATPNENFLPQFRKQQLETSNSPCMPTNGSTSQGSPNKRSLANYRKADINDFTKGISCLKVAYVPSFGHNTISFGDKKSPWKELSQNILNSFAPKHSAILEMVHSAQQKEMIQQQMEAVSKQQKQNTVNSNSNANSGQLSRQRSFTQLQRRNSIIRIVKLDKDYQTQNEIDKEILGRLKWWRLGSKDEEEHDFRQRQSNNSIRIQDLRMMQVLTQEILKQHDQSIKYYKAIADKTLNTQQQQQKFGAIAVFNTTQTFNHPKMPYNQFQSSKSQLQIKLKKSPQTTKTSFKKYSQLKAFNEMGNNKQKLQKHLSASSFLQKVKSKENQQYSNHIKDNLKVVSKSKMYSICKKQISFEEQQDLPLVHQRLFSQQQSQININSSQIMQTDVTQDKQFFNKRLGTENLKSRNYKIKNVFNTSMPIRSQSMTPSCAHQQLTNAVSNNFTPLKKAHPKNEYHSVKNIYEKELVKIIERRRQYNEQRKEIETKMKVIRKSQSTKSINLYTDINNNNTGQSTKTINLTANTLNF